MSRKKRRPSFVDRMDMETWVPDPDEIVKRLAPKFLESNREEPLKWPTKPE